jgi:hypothetical protein
MRKRIAPDRAREQALFKPFIYNVTDRILRLSSGLLVARLKFVAHEGTQNLPAQQVAFLNFDEKISTKFV